MVDEPGNYEWNEIFARGMQSVLNESNFEISVQYLKQAGDRLIITGSKEWSANLKLTNLGVFVFVFFFLAGGFYVGIRACKLTTSSLDNFWKPPKNRFC